MDLKSSPEFVEAYVAARNAHAASLLTEPVTVEQTRVWLAETDALVRVLVEDGDFLGAALVYPSKDGEITIFSASPGRGLGAALVEGAEQSAQNLGLKEVWAWVLEDNHLARASFERRDFVTRSASMRNYRGKHWRGVTLRKRIAF